MDVVKHFQVWFGSVTVPAGDSLSAVFGSDGFSPESDFLLWHSFNREGSCSGFGS